MGLAALAVLVARPANVAFALPEGTLTPAQGYLNTVYSYRLTGYSSNQPVEALLLIDEPGTAAPPLQITLPTATSTDANGLIDFKFSFTTQPARAGSPTVLDISGLLPPGLPQANLGKITTFQIEVCDPSQCMAAKGQLTWTGIPVSEPSIFNIGSQEFQEQRAACFLFRQIIWMNGIPAGLSGVVQYFSQYANYLGGCNFTDQDKATLLRILFGDKTVSSAP